MSSTTILLLVIAAVVIYTACSQSKPERSNSKQGPSSSRDIAPQMAENLNLNSPLGVVPQALYVDSRQVRYWTPIRGAIKSKARKWEFILPDGSRSIVYNGDDSQPPLYLS